MFMLPFFIYVSLGNALGAAPSDPRLLATLFIGGAIVLYLVGLGSFALLQRFNCGKIQSFKRVSDNAGLSVAIYSAFLGLAALIPSLRGVVTNILSPEVELNVRESLGYGYYSFWGALFGIAVGGTFSSICQ